MNDLTIDLKAVSVFYLIQSDKEETELDAIVDEKRFTDYKEVIRMLENSEAPVKYIRFIAGSEEYRLIPIDDSDEFTVLKNPIYN